MTEEAGILSLSPVRLCDWGYWDYSASQCARLLWDLSVCVPQSRPISLCLFSGNSQRSEQKTLPFPPPRPLPGENALHCCIIFRAKTHSFRFTKIIPENERICRGQAFKHLTLSKMSTDKWLKMIWTQIFQFTESLATSWSSASASTFPSLRVYQEWIGPFEEIMLAKSTAALIYFDIVCQNVQIWVLCWKKTLKFESSPIMHMMIASVWFPSPNGPPPSLPPPETAGC